MLLYLLQMLRPLDIVVLLRLSLESQGRPSYQRLAADLCLYPSEVYASVKRAQASRLLQKIGRNHRLNRSGLVEFLLHGIQYAFPVEQGGPVRGVPTSYAAPPLNGSIAGDDLPPVWPYAEGSVRGYSYAPLHKNVPRAALHDARLYELLALVDALRGGRARERQLAASELRKRLEAGVDEESQS